MPFPTDNPDWAVDDFVFPDGTSNKIRPTPNLRQYGYTPDSFPTAQEFNWMLNNLAAQIAELKLQILVPSQIPIGMVIELSNTSSNPSTLFGYGTWTPFGQGRVTVGAGSTTDMRGELKAFNAGETGGEFNHILTSSEMPAHNHTNGITGKSGGLGYDIVGDAGAGTGTSNYKYTTTGTTGGNQSHNNIQPYIVVYKWLRTA